jgi:hypothetical protein
VAWDDALAIRKANLNSMPAIPLPELTKGEEGIATSKKLPAITEGALACCLRPAAGLKRRSADWISLGIGGAETIAPT